MSAAILCDWHKAHLARLMETVVGNVEKARADITESFCRTCDDCEAGS